MNGFLCTDGVITSQSWDGWKIIPHCFSVSPVWSRTGDPLRRDFADQQTVTWTADILLSNRSVLYRLQREGWRGEKNKKHWNSTLPVSVSRFSPFWGSKIVLLHQQKFCTSSQTRRWKDFLRQEIRDTADVLLVKRDTQYNSLIFYGCLTAVVLNLQTLQDLWKHF